MNFFYDLPQDIQDKIHKHAHELQSNETFRKIQSIDFWQRGDVGHAIVAMTNLLYHLSASQKELQDYYFCLDWLDGKRQGITVEDMKDNLYYNAYRDYWDHY